MKRIPLLVSMHSFFLLVPLSRLVAQDAAPATDAKEDIVIISQGDLYLRFDSLGQMIAHLAIDRLRESIFADGAPGAVTPLSYLKVDGRVIKHFQTARGHSDCAEAIEAVHGRGVRNRIWGTAAIPDGGRLKQLVTIESYERYPTTAVFRTKYLNVGDQPIKVDTLYQAMCRLVSEELWAFHPRKWRAGEDFIFPVEPGTQLDGDNVAFFPRGETFSVYGGGLPAVCFMDPKLTLTVGYLSPNLKMVRFPIRDDGKAITVGVERDLGLGPEPTELAPGDELESLPTFVTLTRGDFHDGIRVMSRLRQDLGLECRDPPIADVQSPAWSNRGIGHRWSEEYILDQLPALRQFGIKWIHMGDPWQDNLGDYGVSDKFIDPADLRSFIRHLNTEGFHVTAFYSDLVIDPAAEVVREHLNLYHTVFDKPEGHVVRKDGMSYYGFFAPMFQGTLELRGLDDGATYRVTDYLQGREFPAVTAKGTAMMKGPTSRLPRSPNTRIWPVPCSQLARGKPSRLWVSRRRQSACSHWRKHARESSTCLGRMKPRWPRITVRRSGQKQSITIRSSRLRISWTNRDSYRA